MDFRSLSGLRTGGQMSQKPPIAKVQQPSTMTRFFIWYLALYFAGPNHCEGIYRVPD